MKRFFSAAARLSTGTSLQDIPVAELEKIVNADHEQYMTLLRKKIELESTFKNASLDGKTRCEAAQELHSMLVPFWQFEKEHERNTKLLTEKVAQGSQEGNTLKR